MRIPGLFVVATVLSIQCCCVKCSEDRNRGRECAACVTLVALTEQLAEIHNASISHSLRRICSLLPRTIRYTCGEAVEFIGPLLVELYVQKAGPDVVCHALGFCRTDPGSQTCQSLTPSFQLKSGLMFEDHIRKVQNSNALSFSKKHLTSNLCDLPGIKAICKWIQRFTDAHKPLIDIDGDGFSIFQTLRGTYWRGKDCSDISADVHPGAKPIEGDREFDFNCNGIFGVNNQTHKPYEDELCGSSQARGVAVLGDSISSHFHLPTAWIDPTQISKEAFIHLETIVANELDWPMMSTITGYGTNQWKEAITGTIDSIYLRLRERNHCNHRDYQNIAANGERSLSARKLVHTLSRLPDKDKPLIVFYALLGNDVCNGHPDTFAAMTTPAEFHSNTLDTLETLHKNLPNGSHVFLVGLADGQILHDAMAERIHPLGSYWGTFTYAKYYDFLNCLQISPCAGWMNSNETVRHLTTKRANELSAVLRRIAVQQKYSNFQLYYQDNPFTEVIDKWMKQGRHIWELIDATDGFHTSQLTNVLAAQVLWDKIMSDYPAVFGAQNPNNELIQKLFGDQGGY
ncbi:hypothetical protein BsWGS_16341 [Bradybaena similaris]